MSLPEYDVVADGIGNCVDVARALRRIVIAVDANAAEIGAKACLHEPACRRIQGLAARGEDRGHRSRRAGGRGSSRADRPLNERFFLPLAVVAGPATRARTLNLWLGHAHHVVRDAIGLDLVGIAGLADREFGLKTSEGTVPRPL